MIPNLTTELNAIVDDLAKKHDLLVEKARRDKAQMIYDFYQVNMNMITGTYIPSYMKNSSVREKFVLNNTTGSYEKITEDGYGIFDNETVRIMPKVHYDLVNKTLNLLCKPYKADRYLVYKNDGDGHKKGEINEEQTELLTEIYNGAQIATQSHEFLKQGKLFNTIQVQPVWRKEQIQFDIHTPNFVTVKTDPADRLTALEVLIEKIIKNKEGKEEDGYVFWSDKEHYYLTKKGDKIPVGKNDEKGIGLKNPLKRMPFVEYRDKVSSDFWGEPMEDLVVNNIWYDIDEGNLKFSQYFSALGLLYGYNLGVDAGKYSLTPNNIFMAEKVPNTEHPPKMESVRIDAPLEQLRENNQRTMEAIGNSKGISGGAFSNEPNEQSGVSKMFDNAELQVIREMDMQKIKDFEVKLFEPVRLVYNYYQEDDSKKISDDVEFKISIIQEKPTMTVKEQDEHNRYLLDTGLASKVDLLIAENPDLTEEQAIEILKKVEETNKKLNFNPQGSAEKGKPSDGTSGEDQ